MEKYVYGVDLCKLQTDQKTNVNFYQAHLKWSDAIITINESTTFNFMTYSQTLGSMFNMT